LRHVVEVGAQHAVVARVFEQEGVVAVRRVDLGVADAMRLSTSALTISRERAGEKRQSVVKLTSRKRFSPRAGEGARQVAAVLARRVEVVERARDQQVGVGVEVAAELVALVAQVALDLELDLLRAVAELGVARSSRPNFCSIASSTGR
jgi:hypothetical protein